jgi:hypothetical protein
MEEDQDEKDVEEKAAKAHQASPVMEGTTMTESGYTATVPCGHQYILQRRAKPTGSIYSSNNRQRHHSDSPTTALITLTVVAAQ